MSGTLTGSVALTGTFTANTSGTQPQVSRVTGSTHITAAATAAGGTYQIDITH